VVKADTLAWLMRNNAGLPANFLRWRYRDDRTHLSFHRLATFDWLAARFGFALEQVESQAFLLRKQG